MPYIVKTTGGKANEDAIYKIVYEMLNVEGRAKIFDKDGNRIENPVTSGYPVFTDGNVTYTVSSFNNTIYVGAGVDIDMLAANLQYAIMRLQPVDHFRKKIPVTNIMTTLLITPTHIGTSLNPTAQCGRAIYTNQDIVTEFGFYKWTIRRLMSYNLSTGEAAALCSIVWDVDNVLVYENGDQPMTIREGDFRAHADGIIGKAPQPIKIVMGIDEPGILMLQTNKKTKKTTGNVYHDGQGVFGMPESLLNSKSYPRKLTYAECSSCGSQLHNEGYGPAAGLVSMTRILCAACVSSESGHSKTNYCAIKVNTTRQDLLAESEMAEFIKDVESDVTWVQIAGLNVFLGKKHAYVPRADVITYSGPAVYTHPTLAGRKIYEAHIYPTKSDNAAAAFS